MELRGEKVGVKFVRKFYPYYLNGFQGASKLRGEIVLIESLEEILTKLNNIVVMSN